MTTEKKTVMIVDDEPMIRRLLGRLLGDDGYRVVAAGNGKEALEAMQADLPNLVIMDLLMPVMGGLDACRELRHSDVTRHLPVIMLTGLDSSSDEIRGLGIGADDYVSKPFNGAEVKARVNGLLRRCAAQQAACA
ncbi:MAG: response regulator [Elusimicrobia bacterium]|nr:response regulator [Elusimicrobiota bacterium]